MHEVLDPGLTRVVSGLLRNPKGEFFLGRRSGRAYRGCWETPGGKVEPGETDEEALIREWGEELALKVQVGRKVFEGEFSPNGSPGFVLVAYAVTTPNHTWTCGPSDQECLLGSEGMTTSALTLNNHDMVWWASRYDILDLADSAVTLSLKPIIEAQICTVCGEPDEQHGRVFVVGWGDVECPCATED